jgi:hypothetical protein
MVMEKNRRQRKEKNMAPKNNAVHITKAKGGHDRETDRWATIILCFIVAFIAFVLGMKYEHVYMNDKIIASGHGEYYWNDQGKQFRWKEHPFTWSDLNFENQ